MAERVEVGIAGSIVKARAIQQQQGQAVGTRRQQAGCGQRWRQRVDLGDQRRLGKGFLERRVSRDQHAHILFGFVQGHRQRGGDVAESAGFDPGGHFRGGEKYR